jgi:hypothetical protein
MDFGNWLRGISFKLFGVEFGVQIWKWGTVKCLNFGEFKRNVNYAFLDLKC